MKRILLTLLGIVFVVGLFAVVGYAGYRFGFAQGVQIVTNGEAPQFRPFDEFSRRDRSIDNFGFGHNFERGFGMRGFPMIGFGFFHPLMWIGRLAVLALIIGFIYWLFTRNGWRLTRETVSTAPPRNENE